MSVVERSTTIYRGPFLIFDRVTMNFLSYKSRDSSNPEPYYTSFYKLKCYYPNNVKNFRVNLWWNYCSRWTWVHVSGTGLSSRWGSVPPLKRPRLKLSPHRNPSKKLVSSEPEVDIFYPLVHRGTLFLFIYVSIRRSYVVHELLCCHFRTVFPMYESSMTHTCAKMLLCYLVLTLKLNEIHF